MEAQNTEQCISNDTGTQMTVVSLACCSHISRTCKGLNPCKKMIQRVFYRCSRQEHATVICADMKDIF